MRRWWRGQVYALDAGGTAQKVTVGRSVFLEQGVRHAGGVAGEACLQCRRDDRTGDFGGAACLLGGWRRAGRWWSGRDMAVAVDRDGEATGGTNCAQGAAE